MICGRGMNGSRRPRHVRVLSDRDADAYRRLRMASIDESPELACPGIVRELALYVRGLRNLPSVYALEGGCTWSAHDAGALVGAICVSRYVMREGAEFQLWGLYVDAGHRGSHAAVALVGTALHWCRQQCSARAVRVHLRRDDHRIRRWCARKGFEKLEDPALAPTRLLAMRLCLEG